MVETFLALLESQAASGYFYNPINYLGLFLSFLGPSFLGPSLEPYFKNTFLENSS